MKTLKIFFLLLLFSATPFDEAFAYHIATEKGDKESELNELVMTIYDAFYNYRAKEIDSCKDKMNLLGLELIKEMNKPISGVSTIDSLIFENSESFRWAYCKSVDLDYLRDIEAFFVIKHDDSDKIAELLSSRLAGLNSQTSIENNEGQYKIIVKESKGVKVVDERFPAKPVSKISSLYTYSFISDGEYLIVELKETVPKTILEEEEIVENNIAKNE